MVKNILLLLCVLYSCNTVLSQDLDKLSKGKRNKLLVKTAKEVVIKHGPGYYREYKKPIIERGVIPNREDISKADKANVGRVFYTVTFPYNPQEEQLAFEYAAQVAYWGDKGKPESVHFGNGWGVVIDDTYPVTKVPYESVQQKNVDITDYAVKQYYNVDEVVQKNQKKIQDALTLKYAQDKRRLKLEHVRSDSLREVEILKKYKIPRE